MAMTDTRLTSSEARLWQLIDERTRTGADTETIDRRIWDLFGEEWAVLFTDLAGFSRGVASFGIIHFLQVIHEHRNLLLPVAERHDGILIKSEADSFLLIFRRPQSALECALAMQRVCQQANQRRTREEAILLCAGIGYGRVLRIGDSDVWGAEVNAASKLGEDTAKANEVLITEDAMRAIGDDCDVSFEEIQHDAAGIGTAYRVVPDSARP